MFSSLMPVSLPKILFMSFWSFFLVPSSFSSITCVRVSSPVDLSRIWFRLMMFLKKFLSRVSLMSSANFQSRTISGKQRLLSKQNLLLWLLSMMCTISLCDKFE